MKILNSPIKINELKTIAENTFGDMVKAVVDVERKLIAIDAELHSDLEALVDFFYASNEFSSSEDLWRKYFDHFNYAARKNY